MKRFLRMASVIMAVIMLAACSQPSSSGVSPSPTASFQSADETASAEPVSLKDDFYDAVNAEWMATAEIPADMPITGGFYDMMDVIDETLMADFDAMVAGDKQPDDELLANFIEYYRLAIDYDTREAAGMEPMQPYIDMVEDINSLADLHEKWVELDTYGFTLPLIFATTADMGNAEVNALAAVAPSLYLPDKTYYEEGNIGGAMMLNAYKDMATQMMVLSGKSETDAASIVEDAMAFDALLAPHMKSAAESSDYTKLYNTVSFDDFAGMSSNLDFGATVTKLVGQQPDKVVLFNPDYVAVIDNLFNEKNFKIMKNWMLVNTVVAFSSYLTEDFRLAHDSYTQLLSGTTEASPKEENSYYVAMQTYSEVVGVYYGKTYFGEEARQDVTEMVESIVDVFEARITANEWLSQSTKDMAIKKLNAMSINVGYPDELNPLYAELVPVNKEDGGDLVSNAMAFTKLSKEYNYSQWNQPVDRGQWPLSANTVNAMYSPQNNSINFPAAILQQPFYSLEQSASTNYGGIGAVIAHEITHAFDTNGSKFDENGTLYDWWTEEDYATFEQLSQDMVQQFEGLEHAGGQVNGEMTVAENIADAGGLACAVEAIKGMDDYDLEELFTNWAIIWRMKATPQVEALLLTADVHAPNKLRANIQLQNMDDFYEVFGIKEGDGMFMAPDSRVTIW